MNGTSLSIGINLEEARFDRKLLARIPGIVTSDEEQIGFFLHFSRNKGTINE